MVDPDPVPRRSPDPAVQRPCRASAAPHGDRPPELAVRGLRRRCPALRNPAHLDRQLRSRRRAALRVPPRRLRAPRRRLAHGADPRAPARRLAREPAPTAAATRPSCGSHRRRRRRCGLTARSPRLRGRRVRGDLGGSSARHSPSPPPSHLPAAVTRRRLSGGYATAFSPDGTRVVTASADHTARVWDARTGKPLTEPLEHRNSVNAVAFSPDGARVVTASDDTTARVWDVRT